MAAYNLYSGAHSIYVPTAASVGYDVCVMSTGGYSVKVTNIAGTAPIWFTVSHQGGTCPVPSINSNNDYVVASTAGANVSVRHDGQFGSVVQLVSSGTTSYTVEVQSLHATS